MEKQCTKCKQKKPLSDFHVDKSRKDGKTSSCKVCRTKQVVDYHKKNKTWLENTYKEYNKKRMQTFDAKNKASHASTKYFYNNQMKTIPYNRANAAFRRILKRYPNSLCSTIQDVLPVYEEAYKLEIATGIHYQVDHKIPLQAGGKHHVDNLIVLSEDEHRKKTLYEYKIIEKLLTKYYIEMYAADKENAE
jgi:5-methylcytosine-specific restriction endonuclease McrA